jgi:hypothetical protein
VAADTELGATRRPAAPTGGEAAASASADGAPLRSAAAAEASALAVRIVPPSRFAAIRVSPGMLDDHDCARLHAAVCAVQAQQQRGGPRGA